MTAAQRIASVFFMATLSSAALVAFSGRAAASLAEEVPVAAAQAGSDGQEGGACAQDFKNFCGDEQGKSEIVACMRQHRKQVSPECKKERQARRNERQAACAGDVQKFCKNSKGKALRSCMLSHVSDLSESCKKAYPRTIAKAERQARARKSERIPSSQRKKK